MRYDDMQRHIDYIAFFINDKYEVSRDVSI